MLRPVSFEIKEAYAIFLEGKRSLGEKGADPDFYCRPNNEVYSSGIAVLNYPVPECQSQIKPQQECVQKMLVLAAKVSTALDLSAKKCELVTTQACFTPFIGDDETRPTIGQMPGVSNLYIAGGHGVWGLNWGPGTGEAVAQLVLEMTPTISDLDHFSPNSLLDSPQIPNITVRRSKRLRNNGSGKVPTSGKKSKVRTGSNVN